MFLRKTGVAGALALVFGGGLPMAPASAQGIFDSRVEQINTRSALDPIVIEATKIEQYLSDVIPSVSVITREEINTRQLIDFASLLQSEAGIEFARNGGAGSTTSFFLRGNQSINSAFFIDGVRLQTDQIGFFNTADIPLELIDRIEITRGNLGALHGEAAIGGSVHIFTRQFDGKPKAFGSVIAGSYGARGLSAGYGGRIDDLKLSLIASHFQNDGQSARSGPTYNPDKDGYSGSGLSLRGSKILSSQSEIGIFANAFYGESEYDDSFAASQADEHLLKRKNDAIGAFLSIAPYTWWMSRFEVSESWLKITDFLNGKQKTFLDGGKSEGNQKQIRWNNETKVNDSLKSNFGLETTESEYSGRYWDGFGYSRADVKRCTDSWYLSFLKSWGLLSNQISIRRDQVRANQNSNPSLKFTENSWLLGAGYQVSNLFRITASKSTSFRAPSPDEFVTSPTLSSERHKTNELGIGYAEDTLLIRLVRFWSDSTNSIIYRSDTFDYQNINVKNNGWEFTSNLKSGNFQIRFNATFQDPRNVTVGNTRLARRAKEFGALDVNYFNNGVTYGGRLYHAGSRKDSDFNSVVLEKYETLDFYISKKLHSGFSSGFRVDNAGNRNYRLADTYNTPGRSIFFTLRYDPPG